MVQFDQSRKMTYFKLKSIKTTGADRQADLIYEPVYGYDYEFDQAEVYATTWERKKI